MCLVTKNLKSYTAREDIKVYKILQKYGNGYRTPYRGKEVELGAIMRPDENVNHTSGNRGYDNCTLFVENGFIHAVTNTVSYDKEKVDDTENYIVVECFIPKGTEFYLSDDFVEVAAKELFISDKIVDNKSVLSNEEMESLLLTYPIENLISKDEVSVGYIMLSDKTFVHPSLFNKSNMNPIGIVCEVLENGYNIMSLEQTAKEWAIEYVKVEGLESLENIDEIYSDDKGQEHCKTISIQDGYIDGKFPATKWCLDYETEGTKKGDWYLPASGELRNTILNMHIINAVLIWSSVGVEVDSGYWCWSSSEYSYYYARFLYTSNGYVNNFNKGNYYYVRAFLRVSAEGVVRG